MEFLQALDKLQNGTAITINLDKVQLRWSKSHFLDQNGDKYLVSKEELFSKDWSVFQYNMSNIISSVRPTSGQYVAVWVHEDELWSDTVKVIDGQHKTYDDDVDDFIGTAIEVHELFFQL